MADSSEGKAARSGPRWLGGLLALGLLVACAAPPPTPYKPASDGFGYSEQQIEANRYRVTFAGNESTPRTTVDDYLMYRAAELTLRSGHDYFVVARRETEAASSPISAPRIGVGSYSSSGVGIGFSTFAGGPPSPQYTSYMDIVAFDGEKPQDRTDAYDALEVTRRLEPRIVRPAG